MRIHDTITRNTIAAADSISGAVRAAVRLGLALCAALIFLTAAQAQTVKFVASGGNDANNCSRTAPCKTLQRGIDIAATSSEVQILDSGAYGTTININKSITISASGITATVGAITINSATAVVTLRGLSLTGRGTAAGTAGIRITAARTVHIVRCEIERFPGHGIIDAGTEMFVTDSISRDNGLDGININGAASRLTIDNSRFENNGQNGITTQSNRATITRSVFAGNAGSGVLAVVGQVNITSTTSWNNGANGFYVLNSGQLSLEHSMASDNDVGLSVGGATARISNSVVTNNVTGINNNSGTVLTRQNNMVSGNTANLSGSALTVLGGT